MAQQTSKLSVPARAARNVAVGVLAGLQPGRDVTEVDDWLAEQPAARRNRIVGLVLAGLAAGALLFGSFGWIGLLVYALIVIFLVN